MASLAGFEPKLEMDWIANPKVVDSIPAKDANLQFNFYLFSSIILPECHHSEHFLQLVPWNQWIHTPYSLFNSSDLKVIIMLVPNKIEYTVPQTDILDTKNLCLI